MKIEICKETSDVIFACAIFATIAIVVSQMAGCTKSVELSASEKAKARYEAGILEGSERKQ